MRRLACKLGLEPEGPRPLQGRRGSLLRLRGPLLCRRRRQTRRLPRSGGVTPRYRGERRPRSWAAEAQSRYHMGGSGSLRFCGPDHLQLIVSRRNSHIPENGVGIGGGDAPDSPQGLLTPVHSSVTGASIENSDRVRPPTKGWWHSTPTNTTRDRVHLSLIVHSPKEPPCT